MPLYQVRELPNSEIEEWRAYIAVQQQKQELEDLKARNGRFR